MLGLGLSPRHSHRATRLTALLLLLLLLLLRHLAAAFITAGMTLTAAKFYQSPSTANARLLFRASLLHLPLFMAAFLAHRLPNTGEDKAALLAHNAALLGLGSGAALPERRRALGGGGEEEEALLAQAAAAFARVRLSLPPLPFLPSLPLAQLELRCPSKALAQAAEGGASEEAAAEEAAATSEERATGEAPPPPANGTA